MPQPTQPKPHHLLADFPVVETIPVQWGDMDAYGHVNNTVLFRYFETARIAYLDKCGFLESYDRDRVGAILHSTDCRFRRALIHPDTVQVGGRAVSVDRDRFTMTYTVVSLVHDDVVAEGSGVVVSFDYTKREKTALPEAVRQGIEELERK
jgi:acyl-CoA thioester hydrolase